MCGMCGIVGKLHFDPKKTVPESLVRAMSQRIVHRGPDDEGTYCTGPVGFGFRRLSIIDLSPAGHQPMTNEDGTIWIIFNGEIYNFLELRPDLERRGHTFRSHTDTETILHLYEEYGEGCLAYLRGMFAFALWDSRKQKLFLARDRVGKKPLKYYLADNCIVFGSELKALFADPDVPREIDWEAIHHYLMFQYVPHPLTGFQGIRKLPAGHYLTVTLNPRGAPDIHIERYWRLDYGHKEHLSEGEWQERILEELETSVKLRMISDVPLGAFLSGGVDSSAVVALMAQNSKEPVKTFSIGFTEERSNELPYARMVARQYATEHQEFILKPSAIEVLPKLVYHYEEPYADSSALPTFYLAEMTRKHVTVALNGDGGDENFAGYPWYWYLRMASTYHRLPLALRKANAAIIKKMYALFHGRLLHYGVYFTEASMMPQSSLHAESLSYFNSRERNMLYSEAFSARTAHWESPLFLDRLYQEAKGYDSVDAALYTDMNSYLADDLLAKVDIAAMSVSLEARSPLLDHVFMELTARIPSRLKMRGRQGKYIFKKALEPLLPRELLYRSKKGFSIPIDAWFKNDLNAYTRELLLDRNALARQIFREDAIQRLIDGYKDRSQGGGETWELPGRKLWALLTLELWYQAFFSEPRMPDHTKG